MFYQALLSLTSSSNSSRRSLIPTNSVITMVNSMLSSAVGVGDLLGKQNQKYYDYKTMASEDPTFGRRFRIPQTISRNLFVSSSEEQQSSSM